jgi:hypothetical protein
MPTSTDRGQRSQDDRDRQPPSAPRDEPRDFERQVSEDDWNYNAPFDDDLEPMERRDIDDTEIEDTDINTHGSEK